MTYSAQQRERWKAEVSANISTDAQRYFMMVWNPEAVLPPGPRLLRAVFTLREPNLQLHLSRARVIPMSSLSLSFAEKMRKMVDVSDVESQFVCWATIENEFERVVEHCMFIVDIKSRLGGDNPDGGAKDSGNGALLWEGEFHSPEETQNNTVLAVRPQPQPEPAAAASQPLASKSSGRSSPPPPQSPLLPLRAATTVPDLGGASTTSKLQTMPASAAAMWGVPTRAQTDSSSLSSEQVSEVMEIALLTSRAAAKIVASVSESQARIDYIIEQTMPLTQQQTLPLQQMVHVVQLLTQMENRLKLIEEQQLLALEAAAAKPTLRTVATQCSDRDFYSEANTLSSSSTPVARGVALRPLNPGDESRSSSLANVSPSPRGSAMLYDAVTRAPGGSVYEHSQPLAGSSSSPVWPSFEDPLNGRQPALGGHSSNYSRVAQQIPSCSSELQVSNHDATEGGSDSLLAARRLSSYRNNRGPHIDPSAVSSPAPSLSGPSPSAGTNSLSMPAVSMSAFSSSPPFPAKNDPRVAGPAAATSKFRVRKIPPASSISGPPAPF
jgi:hypothetical protein